MTLQTCHLVVVQTHEVLFKLSRSDIMGWTRESLWTYMYIYTETMMCPSIDWCMIIKSKSFEEVHLMSTFRMFH